MPIPDTALDETREKRELRRAIDDTKDRLLRHLSIIEKITSELAGFEALYSAKITKLTTLLEELNRALFKYRSISENVDAHFTFEEAEEIFEETLRDREADIGEEYARAKLEHHAPDPKILLSPNEQKEIKNLYRSLARIFHPDMQGGDAAMMTIINKAYARGDLIALRDILENNVPQKEDENSLEALRNILKGLLTRIREAKEEITSLRKSELYKLRRSFLKNKQSLEEGLDELATTLRKEISTKKLIVKEMKEKIENKSAHR